MKLRLSPVIDEKLIDVAIQCLEEFEFCYAVMNEQSTQFIFPNLRPWNGEYAVFSGIKVK